MTLLNMMLDVYIDLNVTLAVTALIWMVVKLVMTRTGIKLAYNLQLALLNGLFAVLILSPAAAALYHYLGTLQMVPAAASVNLSDMVVAQYIRGGIDMPAQDFQAILGMRGQISEGILSFSPGIGGAIAVLLLAGFTYFGLRLVSSFVRLSDFLSNCHEWRRSGRVQLLLSDWALVPFSARGFRRHYIVIPSELLTQPEDLKLVMRHELQHVRQGDVTWEIALETLRPFFFWNPFFYVWKSEVERLRELACDQKVTEDKRIDVMAYCMCLLRAAQAGLKKRQEQAAKRVTGDIAAVALIEVQDKVLRRSPSQKLRRRVEALLDTKQVRPHWGVLGLAVLPVVAVVFLTALSIQKPPDWTHDRLMLSTIVNLERLEAINTFGQRPLR